MSWIGLTDAKGGVFSHAGLGRPSDAGFDMNGILPTGTLMLECAFDQTMWDQPIWHYTSTAPWDAGLTLDFDASGALRLKHWQGGSQRSVSLPTDLRSRADAVTITYRWDAPRRIAKLAVEVVDTGVVFWADMADPIPLSYRDGVRMIADQGRCKRAAKLRFAALSDRIVPFGPMPSIGLEAPVLTPTGPVAAGLLRPGHHVVTTKGDVAQIRWSGIQTLPARGRFRPMQLRRPYRGLSQDICLSADQRLYLCGTEVDYLFGMEAVSTYVGHIADPLAVRPGDIGLTAQYAQFILDRPAQISVAGLALEPLDFTAIAMQPALKPYSILANMPAELLPQAPVARVPVLRDYEARTLSALQAA